MTKVTEWVLKFRQDVNPQMERMNRTFTSSYDKLKKVEQELKKNNNEAKQFGNSIDGLNKRLDDLTKQRRITIDKSHLSGLNQEIDKINKQLAIMDNYGKRGPGAFSRSNFTQALNSSALGGMLPLVTNPYVMGGAAVAGAGKFMYNNGMLNLSYDQQMAKINATAQLGDGDLAKLRGEIMGMGRNSTATLNTVPAAFEKILSATNNVALSKDILRASLKGSQAGFADVNDVASSTVGIMNAVGANKTNANEVLDVLFASKRLGVGEFKDFANYLPSVITQGTALGYDYKDVAGSFSYLTTKGYGADRSNMLLSNAFTALGKPEIIKDLKKYGIDTYGKDNNRLPLGEIINQLAGKMQGLPQNQRDAMMGEIVKDAQAKEAFNALIKDTQTLGSIMAQTSKSAGEMKAALDKTNNGLNDLQRLDNNWEAFKDNVGKAVAPALVQLFQSMNRGLEGVMQHRDYVGMTPDQKIAFRAKEYMYDLRTGRREDMYGQIDGNKAGLQMELRNKGVAESEIEKQLKYYQNLATSKVNSQAAFNLKYGIAANSTNNTNPNATPVATATATLSNTMENISGGGNIKNFTVSIGTMKTADTIELNGSDRSDVQATESNFLDMMMRVVQGMELAAGGAD